jgi:hypothetical protein
MCGGVGSEDNLGQSFFLHFEFAIVVFLELPEFCSMRADPFVK